MGISENARMILEKRYFEKDEQEIQLRRQRTCSSEYPGQLRQRIVYMIRTRILTVYKRLFMI